MVIWSKLVQKNQENLQENKAYFINILVQIIVKEYYIFIGEI